MTEAQPTKRRGMADPRSPTSQTDSWITPRFIIDATGPYDLDPCACIPQPWPCTAESYNVNVNGLLKPWFGRVWLNPPYGRRCVEWLARLATHGNGVALVFARTETEMFSRHVFLKCSALLFIYKRLSFYTPAGTLPAHRKTSNSGAPSVLIAYGEHNAERLRTCGIHGAFVRPLQREKIA